MRERHPNRWKLLVVEFLFFYSVGHFIMIPTFGMGAWLFLILCYVTIQASNALAFHRGLSLNQKLIDEFLDKHGDALTRDDVELLFKRARELTFDRYSVYSPIDGFNVWRLNRRMWREWRARQ